ncbi:MAG: fucose isomerase [Clostridiales bacterium]|nr:fucose isomerase [Clostridiales bacterium]
MQNIPQVKLGIVAVSRDCFPITLSERRRKEVVRCFTEAGGEIYEAQTIVENENHAMKALEEIKAAGVNALIVYLGNFGPEGPETLLAQSFLPLPVMFVAAAEEDTAVLTSDRGDAYCGMLNASYNIGLRGLTVYIPEYPVGVPSEVSAMIAEFIPVARTLNALRKLKIFTFGPRPFDFLACNAPIAPLFKLGVNIQENSELDLLESYRKHDNDPRIEEVAADMAAELGEGNMMPTVLPRLAQYEITLLDWIEENRGAAEYVAIAGKCWPSFQTSFGFVPCYVNSRLTARGIPVACEVDVYGALSEFIGACVTEGSVTLLDINNTVPADMYENHIAGKHNYTSKEVFMGFHCGNTPIDRLVKGTMKYQLIMKRSLEPDTEPDITRGTLDGAIKPGDITFFRLQSNADGHLRSYVAQGEVLPVDPQSFGGIGVFAIPEMNRFYRHVLIADRYPHHGAVAFGHVGKAIFTIMKLIGAETVSFNQPKHMLYKDENPFG